MEQNRHQLQRPLHARDPSHCPHRGNFLACLYLPGPQANLFRCEGYIFLQDSLSLQWQRNVTQSCVPEQRPSREHNTEHSYGANSESHVVLFP
jgi:hypothetical protein